MGRPPIIYTAASFWNENVASALPDPAWAQKYPLWIAHYTGAPQPSLPRSWGTWTFWQYSDKGSLPGITSRVNLNRFNGTIEQLQTFARPPAERPIAEPGGQPAQAALPPTTGSAANDRPEGKDQLKYDDYARALAAILSNPATKTPLTIGIYGAWGVGKSFLMKRVEAHLAATQKASEQKRRALPLGTKLWRRLLRLRPIRDPDLPLTPDQGPTPGQRFNRFFRTGLPRRLARRLPDLPDPWPDAAPKLNVWQHARRFLKRVFTRPPSQDVNFHFVPFNAWVYSGSENLWAGLITHLYNRIENYLGPWRTVYFRLGQTTRAAFSKTVWLLALYGFLGFGLSLLLDFGKIRDAVNNLSSDTLETFVSSVASLAVGGAAGAALGGTALAALPSLLSSLRDLANSVVFTRSRQLATLASRRDFRDKIGFMADIKDEIKAIRKLLDRGKGGIRTRVVIFIDDLDRCPPAKAVEVLEAIMLLLADEDGAPFIIFLGIDARVIVKAIEERYGRVLTEAGITGYEYLDKIVQIPFRIPPASPAVLENYIESLLYPSDHEKERIQLKRRLSLARPDPATRKDLLDALAARREVKTIQDVVRIARRTASEAQRATALSWLAADLDDELQVEAFRAARMIQDEEDRAEVLRRLIAAVSAETITLQMANVALDAALAITDEEQKAKVLVTLTPALPPAMAERALSAAAALKDEVQRTTVLSALAVSLSEALLETALATTRQLSDETQQAQVLTALAGAPSLPEGSKERLLTAALALHGESARAQALSALTSALPDKYKTDVLEAAKSLQAETARVQVLSALADAGSEALLPQVVRAAIDLRSEELRAQVLRVMSDENLPDWVAADVLEAAQAMRGGVPRLITLGVVTRYFPPDQWVDELLKAAQDVSDVIQRGTLLEEALLRVSSEQGATVLETADTLPDEISRAQVLGALARVLPNQVMTRAVRFQDDMACAPVLIRLVSIPEVGPAAVLKAACDLRDEAARAQVFVAVATAVKDGQRVAVLDLAHKIKRDEHLRAQVLINLISSTSDDAWNNKVIAAARAMRDGEARVIALRGLADKLSGELKDALLNDLQSEIPFQDTEHEAFARFAREGGLMHNPRRVKRIVNIYRIARILAGDLTSETREKLIKWVIISEQWPFRAAWIMQKLEDDEQTKGEFAPQNVAPITQVFAAVKPRVESKEGLAFAILDGDPETFENFIAADPILTVTDVGWMRGFTFNLNPALQGEVLKATAHRGELAQAERSVLELTPPLEDELRVLLNKLSANSSEVKQAA